MWEKENNQREDGCCIFNSEKKPSLAPGCRKHISFSFLRLQMYANNKKKRTHWCRRRCILKNSDIGAQHLDGCRKFVEVTWCGGLKVDIPQCCSLPPPIVLIGEQEMYSSLKWRWHLVPNLSCLNYPVADKGWSFNKSWEQQIAGWRTLMKCLGAYFQLEIRTYRERWVEGLERSVIICWCWGGGKGIKSAVEMQRSTHNGKNNK